MWKLLLVISIKCAFKLQVINKKKRFWTERDKDDDTNRKYITARFVISAENNHQCLLEARKLKNN